MVSSKNLGLNAENFGTVFGQSGIVGEDGFWSRN